jgi:integrase/recombinase XerD
MLEQHLKSPVTRQRLRSGPAADRIDGFADWLHRHRYSPITIDTTLRSLAGWTDWMRAAGFTERDLLAGFASCSAELQTHRRVRYHRGPNDHSLAAASLFIRFLREQEVLPPPAAPLSPADLWPVIGEFRSWMRLHRGLTETTLDVYQAILVELLAARGSASHLYTAEVLRDFVLERARRHGISRAKTVVVAVRALLRFLGATGRCPPGMQHAIPGFASWQLSTVPRFLVAEDVERVIASCPADANGLRDKAVLLLLARLGLRAGEVAQLRFADIDWGHGQFAVSGKGRRQERLPLPQEVGAAVLLYLRRSRPPLHAVPADPRHACDVGAMDFARGARAFRKGAARAADHPGFGAAAHPGVSRRGARPARRDQARHRHPGRHRRRALPCACARCRHQGCAAGHPSAGRDRDPV